MAKQKTILIVEDEPDVIRWMTLLFENNGYRAVSAKDGFEGFEMAKAERPDLIMLDIIMPKESGLKMYRDLHDSTELSKIPVIMLTGVSLEFKRFVSSRKLVKPPAAYFEKPVKDQDLLDKIKELIG